MLGSDGSSGRIATAWYEDHDLPALIETLNQANVSLTACIKIASGSCEPERNESLTCAMRSMALWRMTDVSAFFEG